MNRSIALFVALVTLMAHVLAIHSDGSGNLAFPYEQAYAAFRLGKSLISDEFVQWSAGGGGLEGYPSLLWIVVCGLGERYSSFVNLFAQSIDVLSSLLCVVLLAQFRPERSASLIAPLFFVASGAVAAATASGMETPLYVLLCVAAFWSFEHRAPVRLTLALFLLVLARPEGVFFALALLILAIADVLRGERRPLLPFLAGGAAFMLSLWAWKRASGDALHPSLHALFEPHAGQAADGLVSLADFVRISPTLALLVFPLILLARGFLSATGLRALALGAVLALLAVLQGRSPLPFGHAFVPALPFLFLAAQEGLIAALDRPGLRRKTAFAGIALCLFGSVLASKEPGTLGPLAIERWHEAWVRPSGSAAFGFRQPLARAGLSEEIAITNRLRALGIFLRDNVDPASSCLSPWPAAAAYLSKLDVIDLLGRTNPMTGSAERGSWTRRERADTLSALCEAHEYVVPFAARANRAPTRRELAERWLEELDLRPAQPGRLAAVEQALANYELITVPVVPFSRGALVPREEPFLLLRSRKLELAPRLELRRDGGSVRVLVHHKSHAQLVELRLTLRDERDRVWHVRPTGELVPEEVCARSGILLTNTGERAIELMRCPLPAEVAGARAAELRAVLVNPESTGEDEFAIVAAPMTLPL